MGALPDLTIRQFEYLVAIDDADTWSEAADAVGVSPSALSQGIAVGLSCTEYCPGENRNCEDATVTVSPPDLVDIDEAFLLDGRQGAVVMTANKVGTGNVVVETSCASAAYRIDIFPR